MVKTSCGSGSSSKRSTPSPSSSPAKRFKARLRGDGGIDGKVAASPVDSAKQRVAEAGNVNSAGRQPDECKLSARSKNPTKISWGKLLSQRSQIPHVDLYGTSFVVGHGSMFNLCLDARLDDPNVFTVLCKLDYSQSAGTSVTLAIILGGKGVVLMNGKILCNYSTKFLDGDELIFGEDGRHAYIFQKIAESHGSPSTEISHETRSGEPPAEAASILASFSKLGKETPVIFLPDQSDVDVKPGGEHFSRNSPDEILQPELGREGAWVWGDWRELVLLLLILL